MDNMGGSVRTAGAAGGTALRDDVEGGSGGGGGVASPQSTARNEHVWSGGQHLP